MRRRASACNQRTRCHRQIRTSVDRRAVALWTQITSCGAASGGRLSSQVCRADLREDRMRRIVIRTRGRSSIHGKEKVYGSIP